VFVAISAIIIQIIGPSNLRILNIYIFKVTITIPIDHQAIYKAEHPRGPKYTL